MTAPTPSAPIYLNLNADDPEQMPTEIESMCMECGKNGTTRLLLTRIPHFKEVILMAFECPHCGNRNNEIQSGNITAEQGIIYSCRISTPADLNRQVVKSESATIRLPDMDFEIPPNTQRGLLNTVEGFLAKAKEDLEREQVFRMEQDWVVGEAVAGVIRKLGELIELKRPFTLIIDDPAGNSYIENLCAPNKDPMLAVKHYSRTKEQDVALGLAEAYEVTGDGEEAERREVEDGEQGTGNDYTEEVFSFPANCSSCHAPCPTKMKMVNIPYFKEVVIMSTACDLCGYKSNEVKAGGAISEKGKRIILKVVDAEDMSRDVLKSESCGLKIPEIDLELAPGTLGGRFTTLEGLLENVYEELYSKTPFSRGDSQEGGKRRKLDEFLVNLKKIINFEMPFTFILDDPLGNSYLQNLYAPEADPNMTVETYDRTFEQNEDLGLNDMKLEGYDGGEEGEKMETESTTLGDATVTGALDVVEEEPAEPTSTITQ